MSDDCLISSKTIITAAAGGGLCQPVQSAKSFFRADGGRSLSVAVARSFRKQDSVRAGPLRNEVRDGLFADATREVPMKRFDIYEISLQMVFDLRSAPRFRPRHPLATSPSLMNCGCRRQRGRRRGRGRLKIIPVTAAPATSATTTSCGYRKLRVTPALHVKHVNIQT